MPFSIERAQNLIGKPRSEYQCNHVVNEVLFGNKNYGKRAVHYKEWGEPTVIPMAGVVVVGEDGVHVGIFIDAKKFIHSSSRQQKVVEAGIEQLKFVFPKGHRLRKHTAEST